MGSGGVSRRERRLSFRCFFWMSIVLHSYVGRVFAGACGSQEKRSITGGVTDTANSNLSNTVRMTHSYSS